MLGEDIQDQTGPVDDFDLDDVLEASPLRRSELRVDDDSIGAELTDSLANVFGLS